MKPQFTFSTLLAITSLALTGCGLPNVMSPTPTATAIGGGTGRIAYSADYDGNRDIYVINLDGSNETRLTDNPDWDWSPAWSPDGQQIAFLSMRDGNAEIYIMNADGSNQTRLTDSPAYEGYPAWSPDGKYLAFVSDQEEPDPTGCANNPGGCESEIYVIDLASKTVTRLTDSPGLDESPTWSPDGSRIAFTSNRRGNFDIFIMQADGTGLAPLTSDPTDEWRLAWSPDGKRIVFTSSRSNNNDIYLMDADGANVIQLNKNQTYDTAPSWSPDSQQVIFQSSTDGRSEMCTMDTSGSNMTCVPHVLAIAWEPVWQPVVSRETISPPAIAEAATSDPTVTPKPKSTATTAPAPLPTEVVLTVSPEVMAVVTAWNSKINAFTPAADPVTSLQGLTSDQVGFWNNSYLGMELYTEVNNLFNAFGEPKQGLYACPDAQKAFSDHPFVRLYFTDDTITEVEGSARVIFEAGEAASPSGSSSSEPVPSEWNGIPIMPVAVSGEEYLGDYKFTTQASGDNIKAYYEAEMAAQGWTIRPEMMASIPTDLAFSKGNTYVFFKFETSDGNTVVYIHIVQM